ncbi:torsin-1A-interacting protein 2-like [Trichomycterus rosablanca]|uniref:torsin-1A-interacting protein 2-like n=1 Tax=Trichomycterus rosablanca TaxID=2290929 RepID=UPI002F34EF8D
MDLTKNDVGSNRSNMQLRNRRIFKDVKQRSALKRKKDTQPTAVNGSEEPHSPSAKDEGSPEKIQKLQVEDSSGDELENDRVEMDQIENEGQDQDMDSEDTNDSHEAVVKTKHLMEKSDLKMQHVGNLEADEMRMFLPYVKRIHEKHPGPDPLQLRGGGDQAYSSKTISTELSSIGSNFAKYKPQENMQDVLVRRSIKEYGGKAKDVSSGEPLEGFYYRPIVKGHITSFHKTNNIPAENTFIQHTKKVLKQPVITKANSASSSKGYVRSLCRWLLWVMFLLAILALGLMGYQNFPVSFIVNTKTGNLPSVHFGANLAALKLMFPSQRQELWKRTDIHVMQHLKMTNPTEPVSLILASGHGAKKTLGCLAQHLATAFSTAHNSSILSIDGTSKTAQDSDQVKLDIDKELKTAFEGEVRAAVIHHFEKFPPGSTLIFYRYCDHENAAYKKVFLVFTVMLPVTEINSELSLREVEEQVQEYLKEMFVSSARTATFNEMDVDKLSGLWSRISHLVLPVAAEQKFEQDGCES